MATKKMMKKKTGNILYYVSWSPSAGEATYSRCFHTEKERDYFIKVYIGDRNIQTWENEVNE